MPSTANVMAESFTSGIGIQFATRCWTWIHGTPKKTGKFSLTVTRLKPAAIRTSLVGQPREGVILTVERVLFAARTPGGSWFVRKNHTSNRQLAADWADGLWNSVEKFENRLLGPTNLLPILRQLPGFRLPLFPSTALRATPRRTGQVCGARLNALNCDAISRMQSNKKEFTTRRLSWLR